MPFQGKASSMSSAAGVLVAHCTVHHASHLIHSDLLRIHVAYEYHLLINPDGMLPLSLILNILSSPVKQLSVQRTKL